MAVYGAVFLFYTEHSDTVFKTLDSFCPSYLMSQTDVPNASARLSFPWQLSPEEHGDYWGGVSLVNSSNKFLFSTQTEETERAARINQECEKTLKVIKFISWLQNHN